MAATSAILMATSTASSAYAQASSAKMQGDYQNRMANMNARLAESQAADALERGDKEASAHYAKTKQLVAAQRTGMASEGIDLNDGSALDVQNEALTMGAVDAITIKSNAWREAWGYKAQAIDTAGQGAFARMAGRNEAEATLLTGGLEAAGYGAHAYKSYKDKPSSTKSKPASKNTAQSPDGKSYTGTGRGSLGYRRRVF